MQDPIGVGLRHIISFGIWLCVNLWSNSSRVIRTIRTSQIPKEMRGILLKRMLVGVGIKGSAGNGIADLSIDANIVGLIHISLVSAQRKTIRKTNGKTHPVVNPRRTFHQSVKNITKANI